MEYSIIPITENDKHRVLEFMNQFFFRDEPLRECLGILKNPGDRCKELEDFSISSISQGLSFKAVDSNDKIVGICLNKLLNRDKDSENTLDKRKRIEECQHNELKKLWRILDKVYWESNVFEKFPNTKHILEIDVLSVDSACRGKGVAKALIDRTMDLAKEKRIQIVKADCNSFFSAKAVASQGFELVYSLPYSEYVDSDNRPIFTPSPPHTALQTFVKQVTF